MGWVWRDEPEDDRRDVFRYSSPSGDISVFGLPEAELEDRCSTRKILKTRCRTEEVEPGKFIRKCEKTEQVLKDCLGRPSEVVQSNKEYTEEDVTDEMLNKKPPSFSFNDSDDGPFTFPGLRSDIESIERSFFNNIKSFFDAADDIRDGFFSVFGTPNVGDWEPSTSTRRGIPVEDFPTKQPSRKSESSESGSIDLSGQARDV
uniref:Mal d 1-associated protein n=1 Tax=Kalanchoe fedtschenkoi TaxID=63787 RepID=A0A7N0UE96_KALFE